MSKKRQLKHTIFIACEGKNTERIYFEAMGEESETADHFAVTVYPDDNVEDPTTHALGLIKEAQNRADEFDEVWAVFDKDGYTKHPDTFAAAAQTINGKTVNIAFSSIAFEQWVLLHFVKSATPFQKSANIIEDELHANHYFDGYEKTAYQDTYASLKDKTIIALENASWLRHQLTAQGILPATPVYNINPFTDVDVLVRRLLRINEEVFWISLSETIDLGNVHFVARVSNASTIEVTLINHSAQTMLYNTVNISNHFYLLDTARTSSYFTIDDTVTIPQNDNLTFLLHAGAAFAGKSLNFKTGSYRVMIAL